VLGGFIGLVLFSIGNRMHTKKKKEKAVAGESNL